MIHGIARSAGALVASAALALPASALAHGGRDTPSESASPHASHEMTGHDTSGHDMEDTKAGVTTPGGPAHDQGTAEHDHTGTGTDEHGADGQDADHEQSPDDVSPEMRRLVLTGFASVNGAVIVAAFLIRRTSPTRTRRSRR